MLRETLPTLYPVGLIGGFGIASENAGNFLGSNEPDVAYLLCNRGLKFEEDWQQFGLGLGGSCSRTQLTHAIF